MGILNVKMVDNDASADTIGEYLKALLVKLWDEGEGFSGKRPFGNSGWEYELYISLVHAGVVDGKIDGDWGDVVSFDRKGANAAILKAIDELFESST